MIDEQNIRKKLNQVVESISRFNKEERKGLRHDWFRVFELNGMKQALNYTLEEGELKVLEGEE